MNSKDQNLNLTRTKRIHLCPFKSNFRLLGPLYYIQWHQNLIFSACRKMDVSSLSTICESSTDTHNIHFRHYDFIDAQQNGCGRDVLGRRVGMRFTKERIAPAIFRQNLSMYLSNVY